MFASSWSAPQRRNRKQAWILTSSFALHGLVFVTLGFVQLWRVEAVAEPPAHDVFQVQLPPPPVPAAPARQTAAAPAKASPATPMQPPPAAPEPRQTPAPDPKAATLTAIPEPTTPTPSVPSSPFYGSNNGDRDGVDPNGSGNGSGQAAAGADDAPLPVGGAISRPQILKRVQPLYTDSARRIRLQGTVVLQATIDEHGNVIDVQVVKRLPMGLDDEAVKAVRQWKFTPGTLQGRPVKVYFNLTVNFEVS
jgi:protein TonB